jgi:hypothetical protein
MRKLMFLILFLVVPAYVYAASALSFRGTWDKESSYYFQDVVCYKTKSYIALEGVGRGHKPGSNPAVWLPFASGCYKGTVKLNHDIMREKVIGVEGEENK